MECIKRKAIQRTEEAPDLWGDYSKTGKGISGALRHLCTPTLPAFFIRWDDVVVFFRRWCRNIFNFVVENFCRILYVDFYEKW